MNSVLSSNERGAAADLDRFIAGAGFAASSFEQICSVLSSWRRSLPRERWEEACKEVRLHPLFEILQADPYSSYSYRPPRGYPGDAVLLDFIYGGDTGAPFIRSSTELGRQIYREAAKNPAFAAILGRRDLLARRIEALCLSGSGSRILSVACGHLREGAVLHSQSLPRPDRFLALDQDKRSLAVVAAECGPRGVECLPCAASR